MYSYIKSIGNKLYVTKYVNGKKVYEVDNHFKPYVFMRCEKETGLKSYPLNHNVMKFDFQSIKSYRETLKEFPKDQIYSNFSNLVEVEKIRQDKLTENYDMKNLNVAFFDIEVYSDSGFPHANTAEHPVTSIALQVRKTKDIYVWALTDKFVPHKDNITFKSYDNEADLLREFCQWFGQSGIDTISGWNSCIEENQSVWTQNKIIKIKNVFKNMNTTFDGNIIEHKNTGIKDEYKIKLHNGQEILSSKDHIFPLYYKNKNEYKYPNSLLKNYKESKLEDIDINKDIYFKLDKHNNKNEDITFKKLILNNFEYFKNHDFFDFVITDDKIRNWIIENCDVNTLFTHEKNYKGKRFWEYSQKKWSYKRLKNLIPEELIKDFLNNIDELHLMSKPKRTLNINQKIDKRFFQILGFIYTDGFYSKYDNNIQLGSSKKDLLNQYIKYIEDLIQFNSSYISNKNLKLAKDKIYHYTLTHRNQFSFLLPMIYDIDIDKNLNIELLSELSNEQFNYFYSGLIDGDGCVDKHSGTVNLCNYEKKDIKRKDIHKIQELLLWNSIFATTTDVNIRISSSNISNYDFIKSLNILHSERKEKIKLNILKEKKNTPSKSIKYYEYDNFYLVRLKNIEKTNNKVVMYDIMTESHLFNCNGIKTHNCNFDIPYIINRCKKIIKKDVNLLSPFGLVIKKIIRGPKLKTQSKKLRELIEKRKKQGIKTKSKDINSGEIVGVQSLDYMILDKHYHSNKRDSYKLGEYGEEIVGETKVSFKGTLAELWLNDKQKYIEYNIQDVELLTKIDEKQGYIDLAYSISYFAGSIPDDCTANTKIWTAKFFNYLLDEKNQVLPQQKEHHSDGIMGAYVKEPELKLHKWIGSVDYTSLYPCCGINQNASHDTKIEELSSKQNYIDEMVAGTFDFEPYKKNNQIITPCGTVFTKDKCGMLTEVFRNLFTDRKANQSLSKKYKKEGDQVNANKYHNIQLALKILLNSLYGFLEFNGSILNDSSIAESFTSMGQVANLYVSNRFNNYLNKILKTEEVDYIVYSDTDSFYINLDPFVEKALNKKPDMKDENILNYLDKLFEKRLTPKLNLLCQELENYMGCYDNRLNLDREIIAKSVVWVAKKKYCANVIDNEGFRTINNPYMKIMGMQIIRSDTPKMIKPLLKEGVKMMLNEENIYDFVNDSVSDLYKYNYVEIATPKSMNNLELYYEAPKHELDLETWVKEKGITCPGNLRATYHYNQLLKYFDLSNKYQSIQSGDKARIVELKPGNPYGIEKIAFLDELPEEFGLEEYVDFRRQIYKNFEKTLFDIADKNNICRDKNNGFEWI